MMLPHRTRASYVITFVVMLGALVSACTDATTVSAPAPISVRSSADSLVANGLEDVVISAELPLTLPQDASVEFSTSLGRFINPAGAPERKVIVRARDGVAEVRLIAMGEIGTAYVTATAAGSTAQRTVELAPSLPEIIDLFVDRTAAPADGATAITATAVLRRGAGTVSRGIPVRFEARDSATQELIPELGGLVVADSGGTAKLSLASTVVRTVLVRAYSAMAESGTKTIRFTPPVAASAHTSEMGRN